MLGGISSIRSGLLLNQQRLEASAHDTANLATIPAVDLRVEAREAPGGVESTITAGSGPASPVGEAVEQRVAGHHFAALKKALQTQDELVGRLLDLEA